MSRPQSKHVRVNPNNPSAAAECDLCGRWYNLVDLKFNMEWSGTHIYNTGSLRCRECLDVPQEQWRTIVLPPDPPPVLNARVPNFDYEEQTTRITQFAGPNAPPYGAGPQMLRCTQTGEQARVLQYLTSS
jgi:hypothetical protein